MTDTPVLELHGVSKSFGAVQALFEVDFTVDRGEVMALVGDNGAGKSTLIKCIAGIYARDGGEILFDGEPVDIHGPKDLETPRSSRMGEVEGASRRPPVSSFIRGPPRSTSTPPCLRRCPPSWGSRVPRGSP